MLEYKNISYVADGKHILNNVSFKVLDNKITAIMGSNGCGKSTAVRMLLEGSNNYDGNIVYNGNNFVYDKEVSILMQASNIPDHFTVFDLLSYTILGRKKLFGKLASSDIDAINDCLDICDINQFRDSYINKLSGGERQRVLIAASLVNKPKLLILDEPTTFLDIKYQTKTLKLIKQLNEELKITIVIVIHDINHAIRLADQVVLMKDGTVLKQLESSSITKEDLNQTFGIEFQTHGSSTFVTNV